MSCLKSEVRAFVVRNFLFGQEDGLRDGVSLLEQGIIDSTGVLELTAHLEKHYVIKVLDDEMTRENLDSVEAIAQFIERKRAGAR